MTRIIDNAPAIAVFWIAIPVTCGILTYFAISGASAAALNNQVQPPVNGEGLDDDSVSSLDTITALARQDDQQGSYDNDSAIQSNTLDNTLPSLNEEGQSSDGYSMNTIGSTEYGYDIEAWRNEPISPSDSLVSEGETIKSNFSSSTVNYIPNPDLMSVLEQEILEQALITELMFTEYTEGDEYFISMIDALSLLC